MAKNNDTILILGSHKGMEDEAREILAGEPSYDVMAVNRAYLRWGGKVDYLVTYHGEKVEDWLRMRGDTTRPRIITECGRFGIKFDPDCIQGGSATLGLRYAWTLGYKKFLIAGVNLDGNYAGFMPGFLDAVRDMVSCGKQFLTANARLAAAINSVTTGA